MRLTIRQHNQSYINDLAQSLECSPAEALNFLLLKIKSEGATAITPIQTPVIGFQVPDIEPPPTPAEIMDQFYLEQQTDPMIQRLISLGVCSEGF